LNDLEAVTKRIVPRIEKHQQPPTPVLGTRQHKVQEWRQGHRKTEQIPIAKPGGEDHRADDEQYRERGAEVGLDQDQPAETACDDGNGQE
jgi:hypothetical protein